MPYRFSEAVSEVTRPAPSRGEHNAEVLHDWLGIEPEELSELTRSGAVASAD
jgi:crotonobetainyl-CoA:carnitine CoA-transferase CaiB-like acyl-CoA transferase